MKNRRHKVIREIVEQQNIETQFQLTEALAARGFQVTQATISRDIKELGLTKVAGSDHTFYYGFPPGMSTANTFERAKRVLHDSLLKVEVGHNIIIFRTMPGMAQGVASCVDGMGWKEVLGTIAGDDTIFMVVRDECDPHSVAERFRDLMM